MAIHRLALVETPDRDHAVFEAECGKGTYVRSLARDIGRALGCLGHVVALRRMVVGPFDAGDAVTLDELIAAREAGDAAALDRFLMPVGIALGELPEIALGAQRCRPHRPRPAGAPARPRRAAGGAGRPMPAMPAAAIALGEIAEGQFHPTRVFRPD